MQCKCGATITFAINLDTNKRVPLVPFDPAVEKPVRYSLSEDRRYCKRDDSGDWVNHFQTCPEAGKFSKGRRQQ